MLSLTSDSGRPRNALWSTWSRWGKLYNPQRSSMLAATPGWRRPTAARATLGDRSLQRAACHTRQGAAWWSGCDGAGRCRQAAAGRGRRGAHGTPARVEVQRGLRGVTTQDIWNRAACGCGEGRARRRRQGGNASAPRARADGAQGPSRQLACARHGVARRRSMWHAARGAWPSQRRRCAVLPSSGRCCVTLGGVRVCGGWGGGKALLGGVWVWRGRSVRGAARCARGGKGQGHDPRDGGRAAQVRCAGGDTPRNSNARQSETGRGVKSNRAGQGSAFVGLSGGAEGAGASAPDARCASGGPFI